MNKAEMNYWVDVGIGLAGAISALSGLTFLLPGDPTTAILGISSQTWSTVIPEAAWLQSPGWVSI